MRESENVKNHLQESLLFRGSGVSVWMIFRLCDAGRYLAKAPASGPIYEVECSHKVKFYT